ncbi:unnamed protein product [Camellia sinensis]
MDDNRKWVCTLQDLFVFFAACQSNNVFQKHLHFLVTKFKISPVRFLSKLFTEEGNSTIWSNFLEELLSLMVQQKRLMLSDRKVLPSFLTSLLGSSCHSL